MSDLLHHCCRDASRSGQSMPGVIGPAPTRLQHPIREKKTQMGIQRCGSSPGTVNPMQFLLPQSNSLSEVCWGRSFQSTWRRGSGSWRTCGRGCACSGPSAGHTGQGHVGPNPERPARRAQAQVRHQERGVLVPERLFRPQNGQDRHYKRHGLLGDAAETRDADDGFGPLFLSWSSPEEKTQKVAIFTQEMDFRYEKPPRPALLKTMTKR
ncbi:hypothetical protein SKAU_G00048990 [Synaphobranchus kaupii]|uniref:Uncharacterized protein n=1 Tax=Synaphobranchus kaupii TaxID=118154 RepID=A0A9Q1G3N1_SYNKA|nr:hypothetical protein SKAU_G00048990 [Synaphobranchus kaupii]